MPSAPRSFAYSTGRLSSCSPDALCKAPSELTTATIWAASEEGAPVKSSVEVLSVALPVDPAYVLAG